MPLSQHFLKKLKTSSFSISSYRSIAQRWRANSVAHNDEDLEALMMSAMDYMLVHCAPGDIHDCDIELHACLLPKNVCQLGLKAAVRGGSDQCNTTNSSADHRGSAKLILPRLDTLPLETRHVWHGLI